MHTAALANQLWPNLTMNESRVEAKKLGHSAKRRIRSFKVGSCDSSIATVSGEPRIEKKKRGINQCRQIQSNGRKEQQGRNFSTVSVRTIHTEYRRWMVRLESGRRRSEFIQYPLRVSTAGHALRSVIRTARIVEESSQNRSRSLSYTMCPWRKISSNEPLALETKPELISSRRGGASTASFLAPIPSVHPTHRTCHRFKRPYPRSSPIAVPSFSTYAIVLPFSSLRLTWRLCGIILQRLLLEAGSVQVTMMIPLDFYHGSLSPVPCQNPPSLLRAALAVVCTDPCCTEYRNSAMELGKDGPVSTSTEQTARKTPSQSCSSWIQYEIHPLFLLGLVCSQVPRMRDRDLLGLLFCFFAF
ncbi:hypothetical protein V8F06_008577 [Rhypophila decipiens]